MTRGGDLLFLITDCVQMETAEIVDKKAAWRTLPHSG
jgi:hypothetical protein